MALQPISKRATNCSDLSNLANLYSNSETQQQNEEEQIKASWNDNIGITKVYKNFDFSTSYEMIIYEGKFEDDKLPFKKFQLAPFYDDYVLSIGDYISFMYKDRMTCMLISSIDCQYKYKTKGRMYNCNNTLNYIDDYGCLRKYPIVFHDDAQCTDFHYSPNGTIQNGRVTIDIKCDKYTSNIKINDRYMFSGIAYKVTYVALNQNDFFDTKNTGTISLMMIIDEKSSKDDDIENNITNKERLNQYQISCDLSSIQGNIGDKGHLNVIVTKDGQQVDEELVYEIIQEVETVTQETCNATCHYAYAECPTFIAPQIDYVIKVDSNGNYELLKLGQCKLKISMKNNLDKFIIIDFNVVETHIEDISDIIVFPDDLYILQGETQEFNCKKYINNVASDEILTITDVSDMKSGYYTIDIDENKFTITNIKKHGSKLVEIDITDGNIIKHVSIELRGVW